MPENKFKQFGTTFVFTIYRLEQRPIFFIFGENHSFSPFLLTKALGRKSTIFKDFGIFKDSMIFIEYPYFHLENDFFSQVGVIS